MRSGRRFGMRWSKSTVRPPSPCAACSRPDEFIPGPLFANAVVLDEFNRATPRMQSGLLEAMEEHAVTVGKRRHALPRPFFCIGTMNPHDNSGTFEMAHASCDRFAMRTGIGYPSESGERDLLTRFSNA